MKIAHLTSVHHPFDRRIFYKQLTSLVKEDFEVYLVASSAESFPLIVDGVHLCIVKKAKNKFGRIFITGFLIVKKAFSISADIYHFHDPELIPWCFFLKLAGKNVIMDVHENYSSQVQGMGWIPQPLKNIVSYIVGTLEKIGALTFNGIVTSDDDLQQKFVRLKPNRQRVISAQNYPIITAEMRSQKIDISKYERRRILFLGGVTQERCAEEFFAALDILGDLQFEAYVGGNYNDENILLLLEKNRACAKVKFLGRLPAPQVDIMMINSSISINLYSNHPNNYGLRSNRLFEALAAGLPVIVSNFPIVTSFVEKHICGIAVNPEDPYEISAAIRRLLLDPELCRRLGVNGRNAVLKYYDWEIQARKIRDLYEDIL